jgi:tetratricopeptide (TPR) repeat protein
MVRNPDLRMIGSVLALGLLLALPSHARESHVQSQLRPTVPPGTAEPKSSGPGTGEKAGAPVRPIPLARQSTDQLFERLAAAKTPEEAKGVASLIQRRWARSGSDTADLLMSRAQTALKANEHALAIEILDRLIVIEPNWAETWNQRANAFFLMEDPLRALIDISEVLKREPRHFGALAGLASIMRQQGNEKLALEAYRKAYVLYPQMDGLKEQVEGLARRLDGRDI